MNIVFFGSPQTALPSLIKVIEEGHQIKLVVTQPDKPSGRGRKLTSPPVKKLALQKNIPVYQPLKIRKDTAFIRKLEEINPDLNVVVAYGQILPASTIYLPQYNSINLHFSLLPRYRGASPVQWALLNGERKTGVTVFELNEKMDEGGIISQEEVDIHPQETAPELEARLAQKGAQLLIQAIAQIDNIKPVKQDHTKATYAPLIKKEQGKINWNKEALFIERQVRAMKPWPSAFTFFNQKRIKIQKGIIEELKVNTPPGEIVSVNKEGIAVCCGDHRIYRIQELQPENKKSMDAYSFSLGTEIRSGDRFD